MEVAGQTKSRVKTNCSHGYACISQKSAGIGAGAGFHHCASHGRTWSNKWLPRTRNWAVVLKLLESCYPWRVFDLGDFLMNLTAAFDASHSHKGFFFMSMSAASFCERSSGLRFLRRDTISLLFQRACGLLHIFLFLCLARYSSGSQYDHVSML